MEVGVLGPVVAARDGAPVPLGGPRHREVLARLVAARGRVVGVRRLVDDLWDEPADGSVAALRTFVAALRRALEPDRPPRAPARLLVTDGPGYALRLPPSAVDAWRFADEVAAAPDDPPAAAAPRLEGALALWRGPAYADAAERPWAAPERARLTALRLDAVERLGGARLALGLAARAVPDLEAHAAAHPWREEGWRLLALALYRSGRQGDALSAVRRARAVLADQLGVDPGPALRRLEDDLLAHAPHLDGPVAADQVWERAAAAYERVVAPGAPARLESTVGLLRGLAVTGGAGLVAAREHRVEAVLAAEALGDPELAARVVGAYDVPAVWTRTDDPAGAAQVVAAAERLLAALPDSASPAVRARLLATVAVESRGTASARGPQAAAQAEALARGLDDPALLAFALDGVWMQSCTRAGLAPVRDAVGAEVVALAARHGLVSYEVLGHLVRLQARSALGDLDGAGGHAAAAARLASAHGRPLVDVFLAWWDALRRSLDPSAPAGEVERAYAGAVARLDGSGMPGLAAGLPALARLALALREGRPAPADERAWGPYEPWALPLVLAGAGDGAAARRALERVPDPPPDLLLEAMWCLVARASAACGSRAAARRARAALTPAAGELAGAGSGLVSLGTVAEHLALLDRVLQD
ncbi:AfsR/SARP family transcriptional regulator [Vallicoccus soli]|uniref:SARP family transcriptional regulator n=1 Tax=Vallicoccus soli TaxID=2339232 RepID=A0A3A3YXC7_9ACTN|nr:BTAD domain-containing putative transcriptional regulator [Vallicoccus soli]RJK94918.1 SARP family transcriptional regulator [Vallicoccus soli]